MVYGKIKRIGQLMLAISLLISLCSCGSGYLNEIDSLRDEISEVEEENIQIIEQLPTLEDDTSSNNSVNDLTETDDDSEQPKAVALNETFSVGEIMTITLQSSEWCEKILPSNTSDYYSYVDDIDGEKFFVIRGELKNLAGETLDIEGISEAQITINGKYKLPATMELEESDGTSFYGYAKPLQTLNLIVYASVSDELYETCNSIEMSMNIVNDEEKIAYYYDEEYSHDSFVISFAN